MTTRTAKMAAAGALLSLGSLANALPAFTVTEITIPNESTQYTGLANDNRVVATGFLSTPDNTYTRVYDPATGAVVFFDHLAGFNLSATHLYGYDYGNTPTPWTPTRIVRCPLTGFANGTRVDTRTDAACTTSAHAPLATFNTQGIAGYALGSAVPANGNDLIVGALVNGGPTVVTGNDTQISLPAPAVTPGAHTAPVLTDGSNPRLLLSFLPSLPAHGGVASDFAWYDVNGGTVQNIHTAVAGGVLAVNSSGLAVAHSGTTGGSMIDAVYRDVRLCRIDIAGACDNASPALPLQNITVLQRSLITEGNILTAHYTRTQTSTGGVTVRALSGAFINANDPGDQRYVWELLGESGPAPFTDYVVNSASGSGNTFVVNRIESDPATLQDVSTRVFLVQVPGTGGSQDADQDGVPDAADQCPGSIAPPPGAPAAAFTVDASGCSIAQYCPCDQGNHGAFLSCIATRVSAFNRAGVIDIQPGQLVSLAAQSTCGL